MRPRPGPTHNAVRCVMSRWNLTTEERFWAKVAVVHDEDSCWLWIGYWDAKSYGQFRAHGKIVRAHRYAYALVCGRIPPGLFVCHDCPGGDNPHCVRPTHLFPGTRAENMRDAVAKMRFASGDRNGARRHPERVARGGARWNARLTETDVLAIRRLYESADTRPTLIALARQYNVSRGAIAHIIRRETWRHV